MRQVKAREKRSAKSGGARRGQPSLRTAEPRAEVRLKRRGKSAGSGSHTGRQRYFLLRHPMLLLTLSLIVTGSGAGLFAGGHVAKMIAGMRTGLGTIAAGVGFAVNEIALTGEERTPTETAYAALHIAKGESIFAVRPDEVRTRLLLLPWVADAEVRRRFPDTISVRVIEKRPFALWRTQNQTLVVERSGAVITAAEASSLPRLPVLIGAGAPEAAAPIVDALAGEKATSARLVAIARIGERRWDLLLSGGVTVRLPEDEFEQQLAELERLIVERGVLERDIEMIDLRFPDNYVFRLHNGDSRPVPRERRA